MSMPKSDRSAGTTATGFRLGPVRSALQSSIRKHRSTLSRRTSSFGSSRNSLRQPIRRSSSTNLIDLPRPGSETTSGKPREPRRGQELATLEYDLWANQWRKRHTRGDMVIIRYADDTIVGFQYYGEAQRFLRDLKQRLESFGLSLHPKKTRLLEFGKYAAERRKTRGLGKPETFDFLGFTHICG